MLFRSMIDELTDFIGKYKAKGLAWMKLKDSSFDGGISKFFPVELQEKMQSELEIENGDILFMVGDESKIVLNALGHLRIEIAKREDLIDKNKYCPIWVTEFPMFEYDDENERYVAMHHPFTAPRIEDINLLDTEPSQALSRGYDLTMNGYEIAGGSIRNHQPEFQSKIFELLGMDKQEIKSRFGFLVDALKYGTPPHGGIAFGFDRLIMILAGSKNIRDVIADRKSTRLNSSHSSVSRMPSSA